MYFSFIKIWMKKVERTKYRRSRGMETAEKFISKQDDLNYSTFSGTWKVWMAWKKRKKQRNSDQKQSCVVQGRPQTLHMPMLDSASLPWRLPGGWPRGCQYTRRDWTSTTGPLYSRRHAQVTEDRRGVLWASLTESQQAPVATRVPPFFLTGVLIPKPPV